MASTGPDLTFILTVLSEFAEKANVNRWDPVRRVFKYLRQLRIMV